MAGARGRPRARDGRGVRGRPAESGSLELLPALGALQPAWAGPGGCAHVAHHERPPGAGGLALRGAGAAERGVRGPGPTARPPSQKLSRPGAAARARAAPAKRGGDAAARRSSTASTSAVRRRLRQARRPQAAQEMPGAWTRRAYCMSHVACRMCAACAGRAPCPVFGPGSCAGAVPVQCRCSAVGTVRCGCSAGQRGARAGAVRPLRTPFAVCRPWLRSPAPCAPPPTGPVMLGAPPPVPSADPRSRHPNQPGRRRRLVLRSRVDGIGWGLFCRCTIVF